MAPGVDVLAGISPPGNNGRLYDYLSGTSMSSPHIAGLAALVIQKHPNWSPMRGQVGADDHRGQKDNTGQPITTDTDGAAGALDYGSGQVDASRATDPGLVYDSGVRRLGALPVRHRAARRRPAAPASRTGGSTRATSTRRTSRSARWQARRRSPGRSPTWRTRPRRTPCPCRRRRASTATVTPSTLKLPPGAKGTYKVTFDPDLRRLRPVRARRADLVRRHPSGAQPDRGPAGRGGRAGRGVRHRYRRLDRDRSHLRASPAR